METKTGHDRKLIVALYEFIGTCMFTTIILISKANAEAAALGLFTQIIIFGDVTGGHFNPGVTLGVLVWQLSNNPLAQVLFAAMIIVAECAGAIVGGLLSYYILSVDGEVPEDNVAILAPSTDIDTKGDEVFEVNVQTFWS